MISGKVVRTVTAKAEKEIVIEEGLHFLKRHFKILDNFDSDANKVVSRIGENNIEKIIESSFKRSKVDTAFLKGKEIQDIIRDSKTEDELKAQIKKLGESGAITKDQLKAFETYMDDAAQEIDGIAVLNEKHFNVAKNKMKQNISTLKKDIASKSMTPTQKQEAYAVLAELEMQYERIASAENLYQITGRGYGDDGIKVAYDIRKLSDEFDHVYQIIGRSGKKRELGFVTGRNR